jgi:hypothetical protein
VTQLLLTCAGGAPEGRDDDDDDGNDEWKQQPALTLAGCTFKVGWGCDGVLLCRHTCAFKSQIVAWGKVAGAHRHSSAPGTPTTLSTDQAP